MDEYISLSTLNDFIFCPYSIYLHNVYMGGEEELVHAAPQTKGKSAHAAIDEKKYSTRVNDITSLPVFCDELGLIGKIDLFKVAEKLLIERKYRLEKVYQGQIYQLWAQYFCLIEMGYEVENLAFYAISTNTTTLIPKPDSANKKELQDFINDFKNYDPSKPLEININKCIHCIYCNLCDKSEVENVY